MRRVRRKVLGLSEGTFIGVLLIVLAFFFFVVFPR